MPGGSEVGGRGVEPCVLCSVGDVRGGGSEAELADVFGAGAAAAKSGRDGSAMCACACSCRPAWAAGAVV